MPSGWPAPCFPLLGVVIVPGEACRFLATRVTAQEVGMFRLSVVDHVRLNFGHAVQNYTVHAHAAERLAQILFRTRITVVSLLAASVAGMIVSVLGAPRPVLMIAATTAAIAFVAYCIYMALGLEARLFAHRAYAQRLWVVCERYRSLLAEVQDGMLDRESILQRRDELIAQLHAVYDHPFLIDQQAYETVRQPAQGDGHRGLSDAQIDQFLPSSLRVGNKPELTDASVSH
jgi:hypothetical protein